MQTSEEKIFVVDDDPSICRGLSRLLDAAGFQVEAFNSASAFLERDCYTGIGCLVLDINMPRISGLELQQQLNRQQNKLPIIFLTGHGNLPVGIRAMKFGAEDFLSKPVDQSLLLEAVNRALDKHRKVHHQDQQSTKLKACLKTLTHREKQVLRYIMGGAINKQIGRELSISEKTVKAHRAKIMKKMSVSSAAELGGVCAVLGVTAVPLSSQTETS